jgi:hypothetical protein
MKSIHPTNAKPPVLAGWLAQRFSESKSHREIPRKWPILGECDNAPAVNEVVRIEKLCEPLSRQILSSSRFAEAAGRCDGRLESLGQFQLRGVDEAKKIFGLRLSQPAALQLGQA